ncbi:PTS sugar transporter subunit IIA [Vibrio barjaei]|uniref:PTS sugar transporter subunit IIA n=1 Tax=Vibrio barjaei TaxID=1676683 RepID=UPI0022847F1C|nr:PTS sugar transporter subunit IIA [Vibrio barjaei]MCY9869473.1 PTS sugar transporter subunit IIA [Vibrio barjaei]
MIERRITFVLPEDGFSGWKINRLKTLSNMFRSVVILRNLTCWDSANIEHPLRILSLAGKQDDLCQLHIEGSDAELACMVLMDFIAEHFMLVNTAHRSNKHANLSLLRGLSTFRLPFEIDYHFARDSSNDKTAILEQVAQLTTQVNTTEMTQNLLKREQYSSTATGKMIALPHILTSDVDKASLAVIKCEKPVDWQAPKLGPVTLVIALILPSPPERSLLVSFTHLTKSLLDEEFCHLLTTSREPEAIKAILIHQLVKGQRASAS